MIPKISRLNKIISIASVYSLNRRHKCFENRFNPREFEDPSCPSTLLLQRIDKWLPKTDHRQPIFQGIAISLSLSDFRTAWTVFVLRSVPWRTSRNNATVSRRLRLADFLRIFIPRSRNCEVLQNFSNPWNSSDKFHPFPVEWRGKAEKVLHFLPLNSNRRRFYQFYNCDRTTHSL